MSAIFYKGEDAVLSFTSADNMSAFTKVVKYFTPGGAPKTAAVTPVDNFNFTAKMAKADTADLPIGTLNIVLEFTDAGTDKIISKTIDATLLDPYLNGGERPATELVADIVFMQGQALTVNFIDTVPILAEAEARQAADALIIADEKAVAPQIAFNKRVVADGGTVRSKAFMQRVFEANKDLLADTELLFVPEAGMKVTDGKIEKLYNLVGTNDAVQATAANRPYVGGVIAPNEKACMKYYGLDGSRALRFTSFEKIATDKCTITACFDNNNISTSCIIGAYDGSSMIHTQSGHIYLNGTDFGSIESIGKKAVVSFVDYGTGRTACFCNGVEIGSASSSYALKLNSIGWTVNDESFNMNGQIMAVSIQLKALSASEIQSLHSFLSTEFPSIETIAVGSQQVATSNLEATVFGGTAIPEVQNAAGVELITNEADRTFSSDTGFWSGVNYLISSGVCNLQCISSVDTYIVNWGILTIGRWYQFDYEIKRNGAGALAVFANTGIEIDSTVGVHSIKFKAEATNLSIGRYAGETDIDIDNISLLELGWPDLITPAWCHYDNSPANGAIYGKLFNGYAVDTINANAPQGFHVPSELEWTMLSETLGGNTVSGGKMKALYGGFDNAFATNESGVSLLAGGYRLGDGAFGGINGGLEVWASNLKSFSAASINNVLSVSNYGAKFGFFIRIFSNTPHLEKLIYDSGYVTTDIGTGNLDIRIPFGTKVTSIRVESETGITGLSASLLDYNKANPTTLLTGKTITANQPLSMNVVADQPSGYTDNYVRINGTKATAGARFIVYVKIELI